MEGDTVLEREGVDQPVGGNRPASGQLRSDRAGLVDPRQSLEDVGVDDLVDGRGGAGGGVEVRRLRVTPNVRVSFAA